MDLGFVPRVLKARKDRWFPQIESPAVTGEAGLRDQGGIDPTGRRRGIGQRKDLLRLRSA